MAFGKRGKNRGSFASRVLESIKECGGTNLLLVSAIVINAGLIYMVHERRLRNAPTVVAAENTVNDIKAGIQKGSIMRHRSIDSVLKSGAVNIALNKLAAQSSTFAVELSHDLDRSVEGGANRALDGNRLDGISQTGAKDCHPWWQVLLGGVHDINHIIIFKKPDSFQHKMKKFHVEVLKSLEEATAEVFHKSAAGEIIGVEFKPPARGEFVRIRMEECGIIHMLQVEVYGTPVSS
mmetsp:Transcript_45772/g.55555  ORF Transcript_45772/g.55555 Transcript_45772/m.55555 type:complete len:236 (+) Transcript_45772:53-760(+)